MLKFHICINTGEGQEDAAGEHVQTGLAGWQNEAMLTRQTRTPY